MIIFWIMQGSNGQGPVHTLWSMHTILWGNNWLWISAMVEVAFASLWARWVLVHPYRPTRLIITPSLGQILICAAKGYKWAAICVENLIVAPYPANPTEDYAFSAAGVANDAASPASGIAAKASTIPGPAFGPQPKPREEDPIPWLPSAGKDILLHKA